MRERRGQSRGFTLTEVLVIVAVIGILASIFIVSLMRYQMQARDAQRAAQTNAISEALEKYYDKNGEYPSCRAVTQTPEQVSSVVLEGSERTLYTAPLDTAGNNSLICNDLTGNTEDKFGYVGDNSDTCTHPMSGSSCLRYALQYKEESTGQIVTIESRRNTNIATSGIITNLVANPTGFDRVELHWGSVNNASSYLVQYSVDNFSTFTNFNPSPTTNTVTVTGLVYNTNYSFRVIPQSTSGPGTASNVAAASTWSLGTPTISVGTVTNSSIQFSWPSVNRATDYRYEISTASNYSSPVASVVTSGTSVTQTGLSAGERYYIRVHARASGGTYTGNWGTTNTVTTLPTPTGVVATTLSPTQFRESWNAVSAPGVSYTVQCNADNATWNSSCQTADITATNYTFSDKDQGKTYYMRVRANTPDATSAWSASVSTTTTINQPPAFNISSSNDGATLYASASPTCGSGAVPEYLWQANGGNWVQGTQYQSVGYTVNPGSTITLTVAARCKGQNISSDWRWANNNASFTRPGLSLSLSAGSDGCGGSFCGRQVNASWNNYCGGSGTIYATQYSYSDSWGVSGSSNTTRWKGASSPGAPVTYTLSMCSTSSSATIYVISAYKCAGCS